MRSRAGDPRMFVAGGLGAAGPWSFDPAHLAGARAAAGPRRLPGPFLPAALPPVHEQQVSLADLVTFVEHPAKAFLRQRLGLSLWSERDQPADALAVELDFLAAWAVGDRLVNALLAGGDIEAVCAAEVARGLLPPGALGHDALASARAKAELIAAAATAAAAGLPRSLEIDVALPDGRRLVGTVPDVFGSVLRIATFSRLSPKRQIAGWVRFLAATAAHPDLDLSLAMVGWGGPDARSIVVRPLAATPADRSHRALELLGAVVDLRDRGLQEPLPLYCDTSYRYAQARHAGREHPDEDAERGWTSGYDRPREDRDPAHLRVLGGERSFAEVLADPPRPGEDGPGWPGGEPSRFARLARRLWDPLLEATSGRPA